MAVELVVFGDRACFTRPTNNVERLSYPCITQSAARGVLESLLWRPEFKYAITEIHILKPIDWYSMKVNEVKQTASYGKKIFIDVVKGGMEGRTQRNTTGLSNVAYRIKANIILTEKGRTEKDSSGGPNTIAKYEAMFNRRLIAGQFFHSPCLGLRELQADLRPATGEDSPQPITLDIKNMLYEVYDMETGEFNPTYITANIRGGVLHIPSWERVKGGVNVR